MQELCMQISCARSLCQDVCSRIPLAQDLCISASGSLQDHRRLPSRLRRRNFTAFRAMDTRDLRRRLHFEIRNCNFTSISRGGHARSPQKVALRNQKSQFYLHSARSTRTISAEGCTSKSKNTISPAFRALDTHDVRRRFTYRSHASEVYWACHEIMTRSDSYEMLHWPRKSIPKLKFQKCNPLMN